MFQRVQSRQYEQTTDDQDAYPGEREGRNVTGLAIFPPWQAVKLAEIVAAR